MADSEHAELIKKLHEHGQSFMAGFSLPEPAKSKHARQQPLPVERRDSDEEEWGGIGSNSEGNEEEISEDDWEEHDDGVRADSKSAPAIVVFSEPKPEKSLASRDGMKSFMSSKVSKQQQTTTTKRKRDEDPESEDDLSNAQNDRMLHKLVHTKLLSGSLDPDLSMAPAQRRKAMEGRILELTGAMTGEVKLGKGETKVRREEHNKMGKRVREGIVDKRRERQTVELENAKNLGNYHPTLKKLFGEEEPSSSSSSARRNPANRGLGMGVGKFRNGVLSLSKADIEKVQGPSYRGRGGRGGGGRGRGRKQ
ncbi:hypothetical protein BKA70DRAFT_561643 [Coprinopsis sp. MPI-PUGE-AT-0042]|nr:hypothetical protein BKA70DRAFT_561643 [Coprinopsis sp. MPI-PUGE-AT-0042]